MAAGAVPHPSYARSWLEVDLTAIAENLRAFQGLVGPAVGVIPAVKADAYGHGASTVAATLMAAGAAGVAVATVLEAEDLRRDGFAGPIQLLGAILPEEVPGAVANDIIVSLHDIDGAAALDAEAERQGRTAADPVEIHLKIDTGMGRLGILPPDAVAAAERIAALPRLRLGAVFMHFADAGDDAYSRQQLFRFHDACNQLAEAGIEPPLRHAANSAAAILYPEAHFDRIRPGAGIYGFHSPSWTRDLLELRPALSWRCQVIQLKDYPPGSNLGYNRTFTTRRPTRVAILPVGYGDGYLRALSNRAEVLIGGRRAPVVGMISMDYSMADVTELPGVAVGDVVTLLGHDGGHWVTLEDLALWADTIPYTLTTGLGLRPARRYLRFE